MILLLLYFFYVALMKFNPQLMDFLLKLEQNCSTCVNANKVDEKEIAKASVRRSSLVGTQFKHTRHGEMAGAVVSIYLLSLFEFSKSVLLRLESFVRSLKFLVSRMRLAHFIAAF